MKALISSVLITAVALIILVADIPAAPEYISVKKVTVSSTLEPSKRTYGRDNLMDLTAGSWCEGKKGDGIGETVTIHLEKKQRLRKLVIKNGFGLKKYFTANNRVKSLTINGTSYTLKDTRGFQTIRLKKSITTDKLILKIASVYRGSRYRDTCIAEIGLSEKIKKDFGKPGDYRKITEKSWASSNYMPGDIVSFNRDFTIISESVPCGDESCPQNYLATCRKLSVKKYSCHFIEHCYGDLVDHKTWKVVRVCKKVKYDFLLEIKGGKPLITHGGKKVLLNIFN